MRLHKLGLIAVLALGSLLFSTQFSSAQDAKDGKKRNIPTPQERADRLGTNLTLSADQKTKVTGVFEEETKKMRELRADTSVPRDQLREKARAIREDTNKKMKTILSNDQYEKWQKEVSQRVEKKGGKKRSEQ